MTAGVPPVPDRAERLPLPAKVLAVAELLRAVAWVVTIAGLVSNWQNVAQKPHGLVYVCGWSLSVCVAVPGAVALLMRRRRGSRYRRSR